MTPDHETSRRRPLRPEDAFDGTRPWSGEAVAADPPTLHDGTVVGVRAPGSRDTFAGAVRGFKGAWQARRSARAGLGR